MSSVKIPYKIAPRRGGDVASCYADPKLAEEELGWKAEFDMERMCKLHALTVNKNWTEQV